MLDQPGEGGGGGPLGLLRIQSKHRMVIDEKKGVATSTLSREALFSVKIDILLQNQNMYRLDRVIHPTKPLTQGPSWNYSFACFLTVSFVCNCRRSKQSWSI